MESLLRKLREPGKYRTPRSLHAHIKRDKALNQLVDHFHDRAEVIANRNNYRQYVNSLAESSVSAHNVPTLSQAHHTMNVTRPTYAPGASASSGAPGTPQPRTPQAASASPALSVASTVPGLPHSASSHVPISYTPQFTSGRLAATHAASSSARPPSKPRRGRPAGTGNDPNKMTVAALKDWARPKFPTVNVDKKKKPGLVKLYQGRQKTQHTQYMKQKG